MIINWITIKVKDFEKSKEFYRDFKQSRERKIILGEPVILGENMECFFVKDPNGIGVQIMR